MSIGKKTRKPVAAASPMPRTIDSATSDKDHTKRLFVFKFNSRSQLPDQSTTLRVDSSSTDDSRPSWRTAKGGLIHCNIIGAYRKTTNAARVFISVIAIRCALFAVFARREVAAVDGLLEEGFLAAGPKLADVRIGVDDRIPELVLVVPEHLRLLDFLDVDVLYRVAHVVEADEAAHGVDLHRQQLLDERLRPGKLAAVLLHDFVYHLGGRVIAFRKVRRHLAVLRAVLFDESLILRRLQRGTVLQRRDVADDLVAHRRQRELVVAHAAPDQRLGITRRTQLLGELQRRGADHEREDPVSVAFDGRDVGAEILGADRDPDFLNDLAATILERLLEAADHLVAEGIVGADGGDLLETLVAGPLAERMARLRARPAGADEIRI